MQSLTLYSFNNNLIAEASSLLNRDATKKNAKILPPLGLYFMRVYIDLNLSAGEPYELFRDVS